MGGSKDAMLAHQEDVAAASAYLVEKGLLEACEDHGVIYGGGWDLEKVFWRNAMADRNRGDRGPIPWAGRMEAREFTDLLVEAYKSHHGEECSYCAKDRAE